MKYLKILICLLAMQLILVISALMAGEPVLLRTQTERQEKDAKNQAAMWNRKGIEYFQKNNYNAAIKCHRKAVELDPDEVAYIINLAHMYCSDEKFDNAKRLLKKAQIKYSKKEEQKEIKTALASMNYQWANNFKRKNNHTSAIKHFEIAYTLSKDTTPKNAAVALNNIGFIYCSIGMNAKALDYYRRALQIIQKIGELSVEAAIMNNIAGIYTELGEHKKALQYYEKALIISSKIGHRFGVGQTKKNIGGVYYSLGEKAKALENYSKALTIHQSIGNLQGEASTLLGIGAVYNDFGENQKALEYYGRALSIIQTLGDKSLEAETMKTIGDLNYNIGLRQKALEYYESVLPIFSGMGERSVEGNILNSIGVLYYDLGYKQKALDYYKKALPISRSIGSIGGEATVLHNIGGVYYDLGKKLEAIEYFEEALPKLRSVDIPEGEAKIFDNFMIYWKGLKKIRLSIFFGKQSINLYQKLRSKVSDLDEKLQRSYLKSKINAYRRLTKLLIDEGRLSEAEQVLDMLKEEEYFEFIRRDRSTAYHLSSQVDLTKFEKEWLEKYNIVMKKIAASIIEYHLLKFKADKSNAEEKRMKELASKLEKANKNYGNFMIQMKNGFDRYEKEIKKGKIDPDTLAEKAGELQNTLKYLDKTGSGKNVALHYLVYDDRISVIITTPSSQSVKQTQIDEKEFSLMIMNYRNLTVKLGKIKRGQVVVIKPNDTLKKLFQKKKEYEKKLYDVIFNPVDEELKKYGATNLMVSLDGVLRYIPLPALWDGESYVVQRYRIALITPSSLKNIKEEPVKEKIILGMGASQGGKDFPPLFYVKQEIRSIVRDEEKGYEGLMQGKAFIDNDFTKKTMFSQLKSKQYSFVHISSHFQFSPGDETKNHLLLGDGSTLKLSEIRGMGKLFEPVKLLVLSACQTGVGGNGEEIDGFGELAQQSGAKSVIASLWPVADESTKDLMVAFYRNIKEGKVTTKIEALRQAQLQIAGLEDLLQKDNKHDERVSRKKTKYSNPYYWGPFIMMGNWR